MSQLLEQLIEALRVLPGVGPKSAQRMAYHVLERERDGGRRLSEALASAVERVGHQPRARAGRQPALDGAVFAGPYRPRARHLRQQHLRRQHRCR